MEKLKKERSVVRRLHTKTANEYENLGALKTKELSIELQTTYTQIKEIDEMLNKLNSDIKNIMLEDPNIEEDVLEKEFLECEKYKTRWRRINATHVELLKEKPSDDASKNKRTFQLPKLQFKNFDGDIKEWLPFWGQFSKIDEDPTIDDMDKYHYLLQTMIEGSEVRSMVESFPPNAYRDCVKQLKNRFAREELLIQVYVRELLSIVLMKKQEMNITQLYDKLNAQLRALESLGVTKDKYAAFLLPMVESALTQEILKTWERSKAKYKDTTEELGQLLDFLKREVESEQRIEISRRTFTNDNTDSLEPRTATSEVLLTSNTKTKSITCVWCDKSSHSSLECYKIQKMSVEDRREYLKKVKACPICLRKGHHPKQCRATVKCLICQKRHSTVICPEQKEDKKASKEEKEDPTATLASVYQKGQTLLQTVIIEIEHENKKMQVRALFDSGSQRTYIKKDVVNKLKIPVAGKEQLTHCLFGGVETKSREYDVHKLKIKRLDNSFSMDLMAISQDCICKDIPKMNPNDIQLKNVLDKHGITLTDKCNTSSEIGLLIGADFLGFLLTGTIIQLQNGLVAINTKLGWTLQGKQVSTNCNLVTVLHCTCEDITGYWSLETLGIRDPTETKSKADIAADTMMTFKENIKKIEDNRYEVKLPFKTNYEDLLPNYDRAKQRLDSLTRKLNNTGRFNDYDSVLNNWLALGIIETTDSKPESGHYLPHRPVLKEQSLTSNIRPVFDASATDKNGLSLNSCLEKGNNLIDLIPNLIINFRTGAIGITSDIEKAFLQISLKPEDRKYLKFLWYKDDKLMTYRHCRVVFGLTSSPFLLAATLQHHLDEMKGGLLRDTAEILSRSFYVDNCLVSLDTEEEARTFVEEAKKIMLAAKFNLRMWVTSQGTNETGNNIVSILGLNWDTTSDELYCNTSSLPHQENLQTLTKRDLLSLTQKVFDPIGYTSPVMLTPKLILQETWRRHVAWDDELPDDLLSKFHDWYKYMSYLPDCRVQRRLTADILRNCEVSLHLFCDASKDGCGACVLLRAERNDKVSVQLISAKSRVTPSQKVTIPRLELTAALMGSRLLTSVRESLLLRNCPEFCWTDSGVTLCWIKRELPLNTFVGNRVKEIRENTNTENWYHIPGEYNWADLASRGCNAKKLLDCRWWEGPAWLYLPSEQWPRSELSVDEHEVHLETKKTVCNTICTENSLLESLQHYFSKYSKVIRMTAWILRFIHNARQRDNKRKGEITYKEYEKAEKTVIKLVQANYDSQKNMSNVTKYEDTEGLIRVKTKLLLSDFPESLRTPYLLPAKEPVVIMLVRQRHVQLQHAGLNQLIADIRTKFWIIGIRRLARSIIKACVVCNRYRSKPTQAPTAPLPTERITGAVPFHTTGVDLAGPLYLREGEKCWVVIYTCAVYRAVHLELTRSLSTEAFVMTLRRFIARRGRVGMLMSDQGTNFHGTKNLLTALNWDEIQKESTIRRINWKMNAPSAAWWGGYWERLIRIMKDLLRRILGKASVTYEELETILCDCESTMNGRPLTYINDDNAGYLEPLTPAYFIQPLPDSDVTDFDKIDATSLNNRLRYLQRLRDQFRRRFKSEYLTTLVQKGVEKTDDIKTGDIVLVETEEKRVKWPLGIIEEFYTGKDGVQRTARVKTATGVRVRPVQRLYKLEVSGNNFSLNKAFYTPTASEDSVRQTATSPPEPDKATETDEVPVLNGKPTQSTRCGRKVKLPSKV